MKIKIIVVVLLVALSFSVSGCWQKDEPKRPDNIIFLDKEVKEYIKTARKADSDDLDSIYKDIVHRPLGMLALLSEQYDYYKPIHDLDALEEAITSLIDGDVVGIVDQALNRCAEFLPITVPTVYILPIDPNESLTKYGFNSSRAFAVANIISIEVNSAAKDWKEDLLFTIAHEYHHAAWFTLNQDNLPSEKTLLESLILEGRAEAFVRIVYPEVKREWASACIPQTVMNLAEANLDSTDPELIQKIMNNWSYAGYAVGDQIMQEFIKNNPEVSIEEWTTMPAKDILERSGFNWDGQ